MLHRLQLLANIASAEERWEAARDNILKGVEFARTAKIDGLLWQLLGELARVEAKLGHADAASKADQEARGLLSRVAQTIPDEAHRTSLLRGRVASRLGLAQ
jgi:hypothetical protein